MGRESFSVRALWALGCVCLAGAAGNPAAARQTSALAHSAGGHRTGQKLPTIPQCAGVTLTAAYLAQVSSAEDRAADGPKTSAIGVDGPKAEGQATQDRGSDGPGFLLVIENNTDRPVKLAYPIPTSAHWYAQAGAGPWLWRASTGSGGALVNAISGEHGSLQVYPAAGSPPATLTVPAHARIELAESMRNHPILRFRPGCEHCSHPQDERYRAVLAYAYLPPPGDRDPALLACGLRSGPIVMPPLQ